MTSKEIKKITLGKYTGYHHNRYDDYQSDWALLIGAGGNGIADGFVTCECERPDSANCDCDGNKSLTEWFSNGTTPADFNEKVLKNLSEQNIEDFEEFSEDEKNKCFEIVLCAGLGKYVYKFEKIEGKIICICDNGERFEVIQ